MFRPLAQVIRRLMRRDYSGPIYVKPYDDPSGRSWIDEWGWRWTSWDVTIGGGQFKAECLDTPDVAGIVYETGRGITPVRPMRAIVFYERTRDGEIVPGRVYADDADRDIPADVAVRRVAEGIQTSFLARGWKVKDLRGREIMVSKRPTAAERQYREYVDYRRRNTAGS